MGSNVEIWKPQIFFCRKDPSQNQKVGIGTSHRRRFCSRGVTGQAPLPTTGTGPSGELQFARLSWRKSSRRYKSGQKLRELESEPVFGQGQRWAAARKISQGPADFQ